MSWHDCPQAETLATPAESDPVELVILPRSRDLGGFEKSARSMWSQGKVEIGKRKHSQGGLLVLRPGETSSLRAVTPARVLLLGGDSMDGPRHIWWNFVSSRKERIEQAKSDWREGRFEPVPDEREFIPLPAKA